MTTSSAGSSHASSSRARSPSGSDSAISGDRAGLNTGANKSETAKKRGRLARAVVKTAPQIAEMLGGPLAGAAVEAVSRAIFGTPDGDEDALEKAIRAASPEQLLALAKAEHDLKIAMHRLSLEELSIAAGDRADARKRQVMLDDWTPSVIGALIIAGFFLVLAAMVARKLPPGAETEFSIMLGALATMTAAVVNYFFGSSAGSREKTRLLTPATGLLERHRNDGDAA